MTAPDHPGRTSICQRLLDAVPDAVVVVADDSRILLVNQQTEVRFGSAREELLGSPVALPLLQEQAAARQLKAIQALTNVALTTLR